MKRWRGVAALCAALIAISCTDTPTPRVSDSLSEQEVCDELYSRYHAVFDGRLKRSERGPAALKVEREMRAAGCSALADPIVGRPSHIPLPDGSLSEVPMPPLHFEMYGSPQPAYGVSGAFHPRRESTDLTAPLHDFYLESMREAGYRLQQSSPPGPNGSWRQLWERDDELVRLQAFLGGRRTFLVILCPPAGQEQCLRTERKLQEVGFADW